MNLLNAEGFFEDGGFEYVRFEQSDLHGMSRSKTVPTRHFRRFAENGLSFFGGLLGLDVQGELAPGTGYLEERGYQDQLIFSDPRTLAPTPWLTRTARVLAEPSWPDGSPVGAGPRYVLRQLLQRLTDMGYSVRASFEYEFYVVDSETDEPVFEGTEMFWSVQNEFDPTFMSELNDSLSTVGVDVLSSNASFGPGQLQISYAPAVGVNAADQAFTLKNAVKEIARGHGYGASFMTRPYADQSASACTFQHALLDRRGGANAFNGEFDGLSQVARYWIGGQMKHAAALTALAAPTVNCAKRYVPGIFTPGAVSWAFEDRSAAVRVRGMQRGEAQIENRLPCAASNPYLVAAGVIAAGLDGVENRIEPGDPLGGIAAADGGAPPLPRRLDDALQLLEHDTALGQYLGTEFVQVFCAVKRHEIAKARAAVDEFDGPDWDDIVTDWEWANLFPFV